MDSSSTSPVIKKQEDDDKTEKRDIKPVPKTLNRVPPRDQNACRRQKMRCEGADNPPCRRCRNNGLECLFEKPSREATLTGEAGLERIRSLESQVSEIRQTQHTISNTLSELLNHVRAGSFSARSPSAYPSSSFQQSPSLNSPSVSTPTVSHQHASPPSGTQPFTPSTRVTNSVLPQPRPQRSSLPNSGYQGSPAGSTLLPVEDLHPPHVSPAYPNFPQAGQNYHTQHQPLPQNPVLPPFSSIQVMGPPATEQANVSSVRYQSTEQGYQRSTTKYPPKRHAPPSSNVTSADSSDLDDDDGGELPVSGLVAPWEVLRGLADVAIERATKDNGGGSEPHSRARTQSPDRQTRPSKKRKVAHQLTHVTYPDVVTKNIITEEDARELFKMFGTFFFGVLTKVIDLKI
uniref:Zn(2)-C6 fungal-type domain-containing protein n=1 Tax=Psilocybe cubensis TaxID=181762 RepID=A0A8H7Y9W2_PSICU